MAFVTEISFIFAKKENFQYTKDMFRRIFQTHPQLFPLFPLWITLLIIHISLDIPFLERILAFLFLSGSLWLLWKEFCIFLDSITSLLFALLSFLVPIALFGALLIFFGTWNTSTLEILFLTPLFIFFLIHIFFHRDEEKHEKTEVVQKTSWKIFFPMLFLFLVLFSINIYFVIIARTTEATNSPWNLIHYGFFFIFFLQYLFLIFISLKFPAKKWNLFFQSLHLLFIGTLALILFPLGYGFDPFVHEATMNHILREGFILPKTPYYQGYYALVLFFSDLFSLSITWVDRLFLPLLAAFSLPITLWSAFQKTHFSFLLFPFLLVLPFSLFLNTTPQSVANFLLIILIFQLISPQKKQLPKNLYFGFFFLMTFAILLIHPLAGVAAIVVTTVFLFRAPLQRILLLFETLLAPGIFFFFEYMRNGKIRWAPQFNNPFSSLLLRTDEHFIFLENLFHVGEKYIIFGILFTIILGFSLGWLRKKTITQKCLLASSIIFLNGIFTFWFVRFSYLIPYEQNTFAKRLFEMAIYPLLPLMLFTLLLLAKKIKQKSILIPSACLLAFLSLAALYTSFPQNDHFTKSKLYNLSSGDKEATEWIEKNSENKPYIVLANQITSAGALEKFGFTRFYNTPQGELYFYPIPTSSPLYALYLEMAEEEPNEKILQKTRELMNVEKVYMIFNSYWTNFENQNKKISLLAEKTIELNDGKITVFEF